ncbi:MAG: methylmalonyl Co-A mutase-associated GTPase MeaB, partial [Bacteroidia bacterium]|nr:methylmalonyl Co-A mutase-associated GTPase MeaB [Bacteroidia bacterium]
MQENTFDSALKVNNGIEQPPIVNPYIKNFYKKNKYRLLSEDEYVEGILKGSTS